MAENVTPAAETGRHNAREETASVYLASRPWRQGRKVPRNVYAQVSDDPSDDDVIIGQFDSEWLAFAAVHGHNAEVAYHSLDNDGDES
jgi:hypothetical protein